MEKLQSVRKQYEMIDETLEEKLKLVETLMMELGIDMWIVLAKEYNEDPVLKYITPSAFLTARRLTCLVFAKSKKGFERFNAGRVNPQLSPYYQSAFDKDDEEQWANLKSLIERLNPSKIGLNMSVDFAFGDGLTKSIYDEFVSSQGVDIVSKVVSAEKLCIRFLETRLPIEMKRYHDNCDMANQLIHKAFSSEVITPKKTTNHDIEWWLVEEVNRLGLKFWFFPTVVIQRKNSGLITEKCVVKPGDLLQVDFGIEYLNLCTDHQRMAYIPKAREKEVPWYLLEGFKQTNRFQDIVCSHFITGLSGNDIFKQSIDQATQEGIKASLYSHPIGHYGHGPGPTIGLFNQQGFVKGKGEYLLYPNTCYALELNTKKMIKEFSNKECIFFAEETIGFDGDRCFYLTSGRDAIIFVQ